MFEFNYIPNINFIVKISNIMNELPKDDESIKLKVTTVHSDENTKENREEEIDSLPKQSLTIAIPEQHIFDKLAKSKNEKNKPIDRGRTLFLKVISEKPIVSHCIHLIAQDENKQIFFVFLGNFLQVLDPNLFHKECEFFVFSSNIDQKNDKVATLINLASDVEIHSEKIYNFSGDDYKKKGNIEFQAGMFETAIQFYSKAIELNELNDIYFLNRSCAYLQTKSYENALFDAEEAIKLNKDKKNLKASYRKACALFGLEEYDAAKQELMEMMDQIKESNFSKEFFDLLEKVNNTLKNPKEITRIHFTKTS